MNVTSPEVFVKNASLKKLSQKFSKPILLGAASPCSLINGTVSPEFVYKNAPTIIDGEVEYTVVVVPEQHCVTSNEYITVVVVVVVGATVVVLVVVGATVVVDVVVGATVVVVVVV
jgi:hypothetical protein